MPDPTKLLVIRCGAADIIQRALGDDWYVVKPGTGTLAGRFDLIISTIKLNSREEKDWFSTCVRTCLLPEGKLFHVGE